MIQRDSLEFSYFFNAGIDRVTGMCDAEGSDVFEVDNSGSRHYLGSLYDVHPTDISEMGDDELEELLACNNIFSNL